MVSRTHFPLRHRISAIAFALAHAKIIDHEITFKNISLSDNGESLCVYVNHRVNAIFSPDSLVFPAIFFSAGTSIFFSCVSLTISVVDSLECHLLFGCHAFPNQVFYPHYVNMVVTVDGFCARIQ